MATPPAPIIASPFLFNPTISGMGALSSTEGETACPDSHQFYLFTVCHWYLCCIAYHHYNCCLLLLVFLCRLERRIRFPYLSPLAYKICINHTASQPQAPFSHSLSFTVGNLFYCNKVSFFLPHFLLLKFYPYLSNFFIFILSTSRFSKDKYSFKF